MDLTGRIELHVNQIWEKRVEFFTQFHLFPFRKLANMCLNQLPLSHNTTEQLYENVFPVYLFSIYLFIYLAYYEHSLSTRLICSSSTIHH